MNIFIILAHAEPKSFNGALFRTAVETLQNAGHTVCTSDLYALQFDPVSDRRNFTTVKDAEYFKQQVEEMHATAVGSFVPAIEAEMQKVEGCDLMIWQFPLWWFGVPAILKGWVDRVFAMGRVYGGDKMYETGAFKGKRALLSLTTGAPAETYVKGGFIGDIQGVLRPIHRGVFKFVGFDVLTPHIVYAPVHQSAEELQQLLENYAHRLRQIETEKAIDVGEY